MKKSVSPCIIKNDNEITKSFNKPNEGFESKTSLVEPELKDKKMSFLRWKHILLNQNSKVIILINNFEFEIGKQTSNVKGKLKENKKSVTA